MEITGKIIWAGERKGGISARDGQAWASQEFAIEDGSERYPERLVVSVFGADKLAAYDLHVGDNVRVSFGCNAREYQGKWYNDLRVWKVEKITYQRQEVVQGQQGQFVQQMAQQYAQQAVAQQGQQQYAQPQQQPQYVAQPAQYQPQQGQQQQGFPPQVDPATGLPF